MKLSQIFRQIISDDGGYSRSDSRDKGNNDGSSKDNTVR